MKSFLRAWLAGFVIRWHTNIRLNKTGDTDSGHSHRCTILLLKFFPQASRDLIIHMIIHDQGEIAVGDMAGPVKTANPELRELLRLLEIQEIEEQGLPRVLLTPLEKRQAKFCDLLDAYLWCAHHDLAHCRKSKKWNENLEFMIKESLDLKVWDDFMDMINEIHAR